jgi:hypothetical protein
MAKKPRSYRTLRVIDDPKVVIPNELYRMASTNPDIPAGVLGDEFIPKFLYTYMPHNLIRSFGFAIDPFYKFKASPVKITPVNRTRRRIRQSVLQSRSVTNYAYLWTKSLTFAIPNCRPSEAFAPTRTVSSTPFGAEPNLTVQTQDTTSRTRPYKSDLGEYEHFSYSLYSPPRTTHVTSDSAVYNTNPSCGTTGYQTASSGSVRRRVGQGSAGILSAVSLESIRTTDRTSLLAEMQKKALGMLPKVLPERRQSTIYRSVIELKDLPRGIAQLQTTVADFRKIASGLPKSSYEWIFGAKKNASNIPKEWLSYNFGWKQIYRDIVELVAAPERITRDINRIIERNGKPTTYRLRQKYVLDSVTTPSFTFDGHTDETNIVVSSNRVREIELRMMVNCTFDFPPALVPSLRNDLWLRKLGLRPTVTDYYNLVPWTWLLDWFTGFGNYVEAIDAINTDRSTFNYGFLTGTLTSKLASTRTSRTTGTSSVTVLPGSAVITNRVNNFTCEAVAETKVTVRKDISSAYGAKALLVGTSLSLYQQSILGALLLTRSKLAR